MLGIILRNVNDYLSLLNYVYRYAKGFGIIRYIFGEDSTFNVPNGLTGMLFYTLSFALSTFIIIIVYKLRR